MNSKAFSEEWAASWNSHDLDRILDHYADDIEITTPMIRIATGGNTDSLKGKTDVAEYWRKALEKITDLHFEIYEITEGVNSLAVYYKSVLGKKAIEVMFFNEEGKVNKMYAFYTP
ncbi:nuclear transport factor 2 family protein [Chryseobacterium soli]|uniref:CbbQ/NirQ/NorQ/GpvN family protein n=1 Tax=Chryseobacterium soli TaxID=445961 RepID=A0A086ACG9_9FLAO|nr:nuclear transport factor 2 family protein [Chryseobacterium soli]KFF14383.1 CbbQ/NirQ/NorQ/GpvN family protein [Chryseobacterium soli]MDV7696581.1 nuclear transport factor 2 family protein [Chryseobacterium soli]